MKLKLLAICFLFSFLSYGQDNNELKEFINKNNVILRTVHKNMLSAMSDANATVLRKLLKDQLSAMKLYKANNSVAFYLALRVRNESLNFLKANTKSSMTYFELTTTEKSFKAVQPANYNELPGAADTKLIDQLKLSDRDCLNQITLTVQ